MTDAPQSTSGERWHFPTHKVVAAIIALAAAGAATVAWMFFTGMGHSPRHSAPDVFFYVGIVFVFIAAWQFREAGRDLLRGPSVIRGLRFVFYLLAIACVLVAVWALSMMILF